MYPVNPPTSTALTKLYIYTLTLQQYLGCLFIKYPKIIEICLDHTQCFLNCILRMFYFTFTYLVKLVMLEKASPEKSLLKLSNSNIINLTFNFMDYLCSNKVCFRQVLWFSEPMRGPQNWIRFFLLNRVWKIIFKFSFSVWFLIAQKQKIVDIVVWFGSEMFICPKQGDDSACIQGFSILRTYDWNK